MRTTLTLFSVFVLSISSLEAVTPKKLKLHHFFVNQDVPQMQILQPWADEVEQLSEGQVEILIVPKMELGGKPKDLVSQASEGRITDLIWTVNTYSGGFERSEVFELPFVHTNNPAATNLAMREMFESDLKQEYADKNLEVMFLHVHQGHAILSKKTDVLTPADMQGKRVRIAGRITDWVAEELGGKTIATTVRQIPQILQRAIADTVLITANVIAPLKLEQHINSMTEGYQSTRFANAVLQVSMNRDTWISLSPEVKEAFLKASDEKFLRRIGKVWSDYELSGIEHLKTYKKKHIVLDQMQTAEFESALEPVIDRWIMDVRSKGIDGEDLVQKARALVQKHSK